jgi:hypothetical protein
LISGTLFLKLYILYEQNINSKIQKRIGGEKVKKGTAMLVVLAVVGVLVLSYFSVTPEPANAQGIERYGCSNPELGKSVEITHKAACMLEERGWICEARIGQC